MPAAPKPLTPLPARRLLFAVSNTLILFGKTRQQVRRSAEAVDCRGCFAHPCLQRALPCLPMVPRARGAPAGPS